MIDILIDKIIHAVIKLYNFLSPYMQIGLCIFAVVFAIYCLFIFIVGWEFSFIAVLKCYAAVILSIIVVCIKYGGE